MIDLPLTPVSPLDKRAAHIIHTFAVLQAGIAFTLANTALGDTVLVTGLTLYLIHKLGKLYGVQDVSAQQVLGQCLAYYGGTYLSSKLLFWLPGIGNWANATATLLLVETVGWTCVSLFSSQLDPTNLKPSQWRELLRKARRQAEIHQAANKRILSKMTAQDRARLEAIQRRLKESDLSEKEKERLYQTIESLYQEIKNRP
ncbi:MAG: hypothetical protein ACPW60_09745 [Methylohalobius sp. ZOD2]